MPRRTTDYCDRWNTVRAACAARWYQLFFPSLARKNRIVDNISRALMYGISIISRMKHRTMTPLSSHRRTALVDPWFSTDVLHPKMNIILYHISSVYRHLTEWSTSMHIDE
jgi:hypothetical protein